jgi:hypothetical protein
MERGFRSTDFSRCVRSKWSLGLAVAALLSLSLTLPVRAATDSLDQYQLATTSLELAPLMAQTFTAGVPGQVDRISLASDATSFLKLTIQIQSVSGGAPSGIVLGATSFQGTLTCCRRFHDFTFAPAVPITAGHAVRDRGQDHPRPTEVVRQWRLRRLHRRRTALPQP